MKVLLVETWKHGGTARYAAEYASGLKAASEQGDEVHLVAPVGFPYEPDGCQVHKILPELQGARIGGKIGNAAGLILARYRQAARVTALTATLKPDIVHLLGTTIATRKLVRTMRAIGARLFVTVHDVPKASKGLKQAILSHGSDNVTSADHVIVHGSWSESRLRSRFPGRIGRVSQIPMGIFHYGSPSAPRPVLRERFGLPQDAPILLFFGSLRKDKGLENLLRALAIAADDNVHLFVVGQRPAQSEPPVEAYRGLSTELKIGERITWLIRYVDDREIADIFACIDIVVLPYTKQFAGQSAVLNVAAAYGVPVIASEAGEMGQAVRQYGLGMTVEAESVGQLSGALSSMTSDIDARRFGKPSTFAQEGNWSNIGRLTWAKYREDS